MPSPAGHEDTAKDIVSYMGRHSYLDQAGQLAAQVGIQAVQEGHGDKLALVSSFLPMGWVTAHQCCGCMSDSAACLTERLPGLCT